MAFSYRKYYSIITLIFLFTGSVLFKYPTIIESPVEIVTSKPVASIVAANTGIISELFVADSQHVDKGQFIAAIQNSANYKDIISLNKLLPKYDSLINNKQFLFELPPKLQLGEIQSDYSLLDSKLQNYRHHIRDDYHHKEIKAANKKLNYLIDYKVILQNKLKLKKEEGKLIYSRFIKNKKMYALGGISQVEYETGQQNLIESKSSIEDIKVLIIENQIAIDDIQQHIEELNSLFLKQKEKFEVSINELLKNLESRIKWWFNNYMLISPIDGTIAFNKLWSKNQLAINENQIFTVIPNEKSQLIGRVTLNNKGAGRVKLGQIVIIKFDSYPYREFGCVIAEVYSKTLVSINGEYIVELKFNNGLHTNYNREIPFCQKMTGTAEIITENISLLERLFNPLRAIIKNNQISQN